MTELPLEYFVVLDEEPKTLSGVQCWRRDHDILASIFRMEDDRFFGQMTGWTVSFDTMTCVSHNGMEAFVLKAMHMKKTAREIQELWENRKNYFRGKRIGI